VCSDPRWLTVMELHAQYGIVPATAWRHANYLISRNLARRTGTNTGPGGHIFLFSPDAVAYLKAHPGRPRRQPTESESMTLHVAWREGWLTHRPHTVIGVSEALNISWDMANRWVKEAGLK